MAQPAARRRKLEMIRSRLRPRGKARRPQPEIPNPRKNAMAGIYALVVAAGKGTRFGGDRPKQYAELSGKTLLERAMRALDAHPRIRGIMAVIAPEHRAMFERIDLSGFKGEMMTAFGGALRSDSVRSGLDALRERSPSHVLIHDGARALLSRDLIDRLLGALEEHEAAAPVLPVHDAIWLCSGGEFKSAADRSGMFRAQTPQAFRYSLISEAYGKLRESAVDDVTVAKAVGARVRHVLGDERNIKVTTPEDLEMAKLYLG